jgi:hypothetical protein
MTDSLKWIVAGTSFALLLGAFYAGQRYSTSTSRQPEIVVSTAHATYPAPEVTVMSQVSRPRQAVQLLARSSSMYGEGSSYNRRRRSSKKPKPRPNPEVATTEIDHEMGEMAADDQKLREAMQKADRMERDGEPRDIPHSEPDGR